MLVSRYRHTRKARHLLCPSLLLGLRLASNSDSSLPFLPVSAHIHVAPEYFQRCDAVPSPQPSITGGAWLIRELGSAAHLCTGSLASLLECSDFFDTGALQRPPPRELRSTDAEAPLPPSEEPQAVAAAGVPVLSALAQQVKRATPSTVTMPAGGSIRDRKGPLELSAKNTPHKNRYIPSTTTEKTQQRQEEKRHDEQNEQQKCWVPSLSSFASSVLSSASLVAATELGDRTFFLAALLAIRYNRYLVFAATCAALFVASAISATVGHVLQNAADYSWIPRPVRALLGGGVVIQWISAIILFLFGLWHLYKARSCLSTHSNTLPSPKHPSQIPTAVDGKDARGERFMPNESSMQALAAITNDRTDERDTQREDQEDDATSTRSAEWIGEGQEGIAESLGEAQENLDRLQYTRLGLDPEAWRVLREVFLVILLAEWGDKSMFTTISLATAQDAWGVFVGSCLGHAIVTLAGVMGGLILQRWLNEFSLNFVAGILMVAIGLGAAIETMY